MSLLRRPMGFVQRPLDFFVGYLLVFQGVYPFLDPEYPERYDNSIQMIVYWRSLYFIIAGLIIMIALSIRWKQKLIIPSLVAEMFAWLFVFFAAFATVLASWWIPTSAFVYPTGGPEWWGWLSWWVFLCLCSFYRYKDMKRFYKFGGPI